MCQIFAGQDPQSYEPVTRSVRLGGHSTSIRLEGKFWEILDDIAAQQGMTTPRFLSTLYDEILDLRGEVRNFASLLRVSCTKIMESRTETMAAAEAELRGRAHGEMAAPMRRVAAVGGRA